jgi:hypothetical protein
MYFKVALLFLFGIIISGCSFTNKPTPKPQVVENNATQQPIEDNTTIIPIEKPKKVLKKRDKYNLKPEPFSLESNENDPELLGPQSTLGGLSKAEEEDSKKSIKSKEPKEEKL